MNEVKFIDYVSDFLFLVGEKVYAGSREDLLEWAVGEDGFDEKELTYLIKSEMIVEVGTMVGNKYRLTRMLPSHAQTVSDEFRMLAQHITDGNNTALDVMKYMAERIAHLGE